MAGLGQKLLDGIGVHPSVKHFDGHFRLEIEMFAQIDICETALTEHMEQPIVPQPLSGLINHCSASSDILALWPAVAFRKRDRSGPYQKAKPAVEKWILHVLKRIPSHHVLSLLATRCNAPTSTIQAVPF